jgi:2-methylisocitrate lyase-like PEP mutase family enzyme
MTNIEEKGRAFRAMHQQSAPFVLANAWDAGSARLLSGANQVAIGTTSAGYAFSLGLTDNKVGRDAILENAGRIAKATELPVSADLENGFSDSPKGVAETISLAGKLGLVGGSIEDATYKDKAPLYELAESFDRVSAAAEAARNLPFEFTLTARAENFLVGQPDIDDAIKRLQAYQEAGADVLYIPGLVKVEDIRAVLSSIDKPLNVVVGLSPAMPNLGTLRKMGVARISIGSALARLAYGEAVRAASDILATERFDSIFGAMEYSEMSGRLL